MVTSVDQRGLAASLGAADYMLKPVRWDRFSKVMDRFRTPDGRILLVEDDAAIRLELRTVLEGDGWTVTEAGNGQEGLDARERPARAGPARPDHARDGRFRLPGGAPRAAGMRRDARRGPDRA